MNFIRKIISMEQLEERTKVFMYMSCDEAVTIFLLNMTNFRSRSGQWMSNINSFNDAL